MPTVKEIFEDPPESWESSDNDCEDDLRKKAENGSNTTSDKSDWTSEKSDWTLDTSDEIEPGDRIFMTTAHDCKT